MPRLEAICLPFALPLSLILRGSPAVLRLTLQNKILHLARIVVETAPETDVPTRACLSYVQRDQPTYSAALRAGANRSE